MTKARQACVSAQVLLQVGDTDGAANRAYYAMFDAACAALMHVEASQGQDPIRQPWIRTHSGLISAFGIQIVKAGLVSKDLGRVLNRAHELRQIADYQHRSVEIDDARVLVQQAQMFVDTIGRVFNI